MIFSFAPLAGGVTLSGGEVLMQAPFAVRFLQRLRRWDVRCAIETAGDAPASRLLSLAKECDEVLFDLKIMDVRLARETINMNLPRVLANLRLMVAEGVNVIPRLPLIPGFTMNVEKHAAGVDAVVIIRHKAGTPATVSSIRRTEIQPARITLVDERSARSVGARGWYDT
ncbi:pyruvate formate-lyase 2 activating enzyme [Citrobacter freundii]|nr:pyruvate formate-lyase 2 activating enzyme [Citrobacter freundii]